MHILVYFSNYMKYKWISTLDQDLSLNRSHGIVLTNFNFSICKGGLKSDLSRSYFLVRILFWYNLSTYLFKLKAAAKCQAADT